VVVPKEARRPFDSKLVFEQLVREQAAINEAHIQWAEREEEEEKKKKKPVEQVMARISCFLESSWSALLSVSWFLLSR
jgi:hypothetical protein